MVKVFFFVWLLMSFGSFAIGQNAAASRPSEPVRPQRLLALVTSAQTAPAELAVETLISLVERGRIRDSKWKREILEESFRLTDQVKNPVRLRVVPTLGVPVDTQAGYLSYAYDLQLDRLSLKSRVIKQMQLVDKDRARQMVFEIGGKLNLGKRGCTDLLVPEVSAIYAVVGDVAKRSFSDKEVGEGVRGLFVLPWFENIESPTQVGPALDLLKQMQGSQPERHLLFTAFASAIRKDFNDDRSFMFAVERDRLAARVGVLVSGLDDPGKADISLAFREFLIRNFRAPRCRDNEINETAQLPAVVRDANFLFANKPLTPEDVLHTELKDGPKIVQYWTSVEANRLMEQFREIRNQNEKVSESENGAFAEWEVRIGTFLENLGSWNASDDETESAVFNQKCVLFNSLASTVPEGKIRQSVVRLYLRYLANSSVQKENYILWLRYVRQVASGFPEIFQHAAADLHNPSFAVIIASNTLPSSENDKSVKPTKN